MAKQNSPRIFVTLAAPTLAALEALATHVTGTPVGYELRLDYLEDFSQFEYHLHQMLARLHFPQMIATCRMAAAGGKFQGTLADQSAILSAAIRAGCQWIDIEIESVQKGGSGILKEFRPARTIVSYHNYQKTPALAATYPAHGAATRGSGQDRDDGAKSERHPPDSLVAEGAWAA